MLEFAVVNPCSSPVQEKHCCELTTVILVAKLSVQAVIATNVSPAFRIVDETIYHLFTDYR